MAGSFAEFQSEIKRLLADGHMVRARQRLAAATHAARGLHEFAWIAQTHAKFGPAATTFPVAILSTVTLDTLRPVLQAEAGAHSLAVEPYFGGYGQLETELAPGGGAVRHEPKSVVFAWRLDDLAPQLCVFSPETARREADSLLDRISNLLTLARQSLPNASLLLHSFVPPETGPLGVLDGEHTAGLTSLVRTLNERLRELARATPAAHVIDCERLARRSGAAWHDVRFYFRARAPYGVPALAELAHEYVKYFRAISGRTKKVLVVDLDNTLWGGIVGEDGVGGIHVGHEYPGNCFLAFQQELRQLSARGVVLAINSKNNEADVREAFARRAEMAVAWEDFAAYRINWQNKAQNMRELAEELSLGLDSFVFVDDNPAELEIIQQELPEVAVIAVPTEPAELPGQVTRSGLFDSLVFTPEDRQRTRMYRAETERRELERSTPDLESFWRSLGMKLTVYEVSAEETARVAQLTQRTNQFNMTTRRYSEADIEQFRRSGRHQVRAYRLEDRFGDHGIIGVSIVEVRTLAPASGDDIRTLAPASEDLPTRQTLDHPRAPARARVANGVVQSSALPGEFNSGGMPAFADWSIDTFLMSCRVIGRTVEQTILTLIASAARAAGAKRLIGDLLPTKKNAPAQYVYPQFGFVASEPLPEGGTRYTLDLAGPVKPLPDWISVVGPAPSGS